MAEVTRSELDSTEASRGIQERALGAARDELATLEVRRTNLLATVVVLEALLKSDPWEAPKAPSFTALGEEAFMRMRWVKGRLVAPEEVTDV